MCKQCEVNPVYEFTNKRKLCKNCFASWFEKKFFYCIKKFGLICKGDIIKYKQGNDFRSVVLKKMLEYYAKRAPVEVVNFEDKQKKANKIAYPESTDSEAEKIVKKIIKEDVKDIKVSSPKIKKANVEIIKPLYLFLDKEILLYAKIKNLKYKRPLKKEGKIPKFIDDLEKKHPEIKRAIIKGYLDLFE